MRARWRTVVRAGEQTEVRAERRAYIKAEGSAEVRAEVRQEIKVCKSNCEQEFESRRLEYARTRGRMRKQQ
jgi:5-deoxy-D-glucuronate isomerase